MSSPLLSSPLLSSPREYIVSQRVSPDETPDLGQKRNSVERFAQNKLPTPHCRPSLTWELFEQENWRELLLQFFEKEFQGMMPRKMLARSSHEREDDFPGGAFESILLPKNGEKISAQDNISVLRGFDPNLDLWNKSGLEEIFHHLNSSLTAEIYREKDRVKAFIDQLKAEIPILEAQLKECSEESRKMSRRMFDAYADGYAAEGKKLADELSTKTEKLRDLEARIKGLQHSKEEKEEGLKAFENSKRTILRSFERHIGDLEMLDIVEQTRNEMIRLASPAFSLPIAKAIRQDPQKFQDFDPSHMNLYLNELIPDATVFTAVPLSTGEISVRFTAGEVETEYSFPQKLHHLLFSPGEKTPREGSSRYEEYLQKFFPQLNIPQLLESITKAQSLFDTPQETEIVVGEKGKQYTFVQSREVPQEEVLPDEIFQEECDVEQRVPLHTVERAKKGPEKRHCTVIQLDELGISDIESLRDYYREMFALAVESDDYLVEMGLFSKSGRIGFDDFEILRLRDEIIANAGVLLRCYQDGLHGLERTNKSGLNSHQKNSATGVHQITGYGYNQLPESTFPWKKTGDKVTIILRDEQDGSGDKMYAF